MFRIFTLCSKIKIPVINQNVTFGIQRRTINSLSNIKGSQKLKATDEIPEGYDLIYRSTLQKYVKFSHAFATASTVFVAPLAIYAHLTSQVETAFPNDQLIGESIDMYIFGASFFVFNLALIITCAKVCFRIYFNETKNHFIAVMPQKFMPFKTYNTDFKVGEVVKLPPSDWVPRIAEVFPWSNSRYRMANQTVFLVEHSFRTPADLALMLKNG